MCALECSQDGFPAPSHWRAPPPAAQWLGASVQQPDCCPAQSPATSLSGGPPACMTFPADGEAHCLVAYFELANQNKLQGKVFHIKVG